MVPKPTRKIPCLGGVFMNSVPEEVLDYLDELNIETVNKKDIKKAIDFLEQRGLLN